MSSLLSLSARIQVRGNNPEHAVFRLDGRRQEGGSPVGTGARNMLLIPGVSLR